MLLLHGDPMNKLTEEIQPTDKGSFTTLVSKGRAGLFSSKHQLTTKRKMPIMH